MTSSSSPRALLLAYSDEEGAELKATLSKEGWEITSQRYPTEEVPLDKVSLRTADLLILMQPKAQVEGFVQKRMQAAPRIVPLLILGAPNSEESLTLEAGFLAKKLPLTGGVIDAVLTALPYLTATATLLNNQRDRTKEIDISQEIADLNLNRLLRKLDEIEGAKRELTTLVAERNELYAKLSHEFRTPLNIMIGFSQLLEESQNEKQWRESVSSIKAAGKQLQVLVDNFLDYAKLNANQVALESIPFDVKEELERVVTMFKGQARTKGLDLSINFLGSIPSQIQGDLTRLQQVLLNLLSNALKFTLEGSITVDVSSTPIESNGTKLEVSVVDTGIGIASDRLPSVFETFSQASNSTTRRFGGTGLGLTIVKELVALMQGELAVESEEGKGSCFRFSIPFSLSSESSEIILSEDAENGPSLAGMKVLVAEDDEMNQLLVKRVLEPEGLILTFANDGQEAVDRVAGQDIVLMDLQMPNMDGLTALKHLITEGVKTPVIILSANPEKLEKDNCIEAGACAYLTKPLDSHRLLSMLTECKRRKESSTGLIDLSILEELAGDDVQLIDNALDILLRDLPVCLVNLDNFLSSKDEEGLKFTLHKMRSSFGYFGVQRCTELVDELGENAEGLADSPIWSSLIPLCRHLLEEAEALSQKRSSVAG